MIGATPPSSICTGARRRQLREFAPHSRESLILPLRGANFLQGRGAGGRGSLRLLPGKALFLRREAQTFHPEKRRRLREFAPHSRESLILPLRGANPSPGKAPRRRCEFAPHSRESLILPSRGANLSPGRAAAGCGSLRLPPGKALFLRREAQTFHPEKPRRLREFAPHSRESLILPLRGANPAPGKGAGGCVSLRPIPRKGLFFR